MAKKTKRARRRTVVAQPQAAEIRQPQAQPTAKSAVPAKAGAPAKVDLAQEYHYVITDLKKIGSIAAIMFVLLFVLAFVLR